jgi:gamma-glutamyltranspeptidase/glutathione hydrolase
VSSRFALPKNQVPAGVAAAHPETVAAGYSVLKSGGSAADAAVAATLAACVAETVFTGLGGGGFATYWSASEQRATSLDFFVTVPGIGAEQAPVPMSRLQISFGGVEQAYSVGASSVGVPGIAAGCAELHQRWGRLPWPELVAPALRLASAGVAIPATHARVLRTVEDSLLIGEGALAYAPEGELVEAGDRVHHPGLDRTLRLLATEGAATFYRGTLARAIVHAVDDGGGVLSLADLAAFSVQELPAATAHFAGHVVHARLDLNDTLGAFASLPAAIGDLTAGERAVAVTRALGGPEERGDTTNVTVVDPDGNACVVTTTMGLGSGVWLPGFGVHLNSMLGEGELLRGRERRPGDRMGSMMCPLVVTDEHGLALAAGAAGASRIRTALLHSVVGVLVEGRTPAEAVALPRIHPVHGVAHLEPGVPLEAVSALETAGYRIKQWDTYDHYFGGASVIGRAGAGADPRRDGAAALV